jgi:NitT/TauT family transport system substrate-binding protein
VSAVSARLACWSLCAWLILLAGCVGPTGTPAATAPSASQPAAGGAAQAAPPAPLPIVVNQSAINGAQAGIWTAYDTGLFREQGLDVELVSVASTTQALKAMVTGQIHFGTLDPVSAIQASAEGADVVLLFGAANRLIFSVLSQPSIQQPQELRGKTVAITRIGSASHTAGRVAFKGWGLVPDQDFALRQLGEAAAILAGLQAGQVDAGVMSAPTSTRARHAGYRELINLYIDGPDYPSLAVGAPRGWVTANEEAVRRFGRAYVLGLQRFKADPATGRAVYKKYFQIDDDAVVNETYTQYAASFAPIPYISEEGLARLLADLTAEDASLAGRQATEWIDTRFLREIEASGLVR